ncbi:hypothetical protein REMIM1_CH02482 [Rhizobium etli bv. mimosae str. Mim1]|nr:hypothetical protein REMIM1_CH02482 [Rhizobium etli bv. mimosae str. Mim1]
MTRHEHFSSNRSCDRDRTASPPAISAPVSQGMPETRRQPDRSSGEDPARIEPDPKGSEPADQSAEAMISAKRF